jgi:uncharacterized protein (DUF2267 family)
MRYHEFINRVQERTDLGSRDEAARATEATLATLGERLYRTERENLAAQLPDELKEDLFKRVDSEVIRRDVDRFSLEEFYIRVSARAEVGYPDAVKRAQAVIAVLQEAVSAGEIEDVLSKLPDEYGELFGE